MTEKSISKLLSEQEKTEVIKIIIEALQKAIEEKPTDGGAIVQRLCEKCAHYQVCYPRLVGKPEELLRLSYCEFYREEE